MKTYYKIIGVLLILIFNSCKKDWLNIKSDAKLSVPATLKDFQALLDDPTFMTISESEKGEIASDGHYITDQSFQNASVDENKDAYIWSKTTRHMGATGNWTTLYKKILYCNVVLDGISKYKVNTSAELELINNIRGQALFQRGFEFFQLSLLYSPSFQKNEDSDLGLIMRLNVDITAPSFRSTIKATYAQIIDDLTEAVKLLPDRPLILTRGSKTAALAMLARVYLYMGNYENALRYSDECLKIYSKLIDFNSIPNNNRFIGIYNEEVLFHATLYPGNGFVTSSCLIDNELVNSYDIDDLRKKVYFLKNVSGAYTFIGNYYKSASFLFCGLATDEMYLTRAECYIRTSKVTDGIKDLNTLLKTRWNKNVSYPNVVIVNAESALKIVLQERYKSLMLRGIRWMDLKRLNSDPLFSKTITRTIAGIIYTLKPNSYQYTFPIPDDVVEMTGVKQNPGW